MEPLDLAGTIDSFLQERGSDLIGRPLFHNLVLLSSEVVESFLAEPQVRPLPRVLQVE